MNTEKHGDKKTCNCNFLSLINLSQNFKNNSLLSHESEVNKLQEEGDRLIDMKHPASATIQVAVITQQTLLRKSWPQVLL